MAEIKDRAHGWVGSKFVGIPGAAPAAAPTAAAPKPVGSQGKVAGEWKGSTYIGPGTPPPAAAPGSFVPPPAAGPPDPSTGEAPPAQIAPSPEALAEATQNYWAPDRAAELARLGGTAPAAAAAGTPSANSPWTDPRSSSQREAFKNAWMSTGKDVAKQNALLAQYGLTADKSGRVRLPSGEMLDLRIGANAGINQAAWTGIAGQGAKVGQTQGPAGGGGGGGTGTAPPGPVGTTTPPTGGGLAPGAGAPGTTDLRNQLVNTLIQRAGQGYNIDPATNQNIRSQADPYAAQVERDKRNYLADTAESAGQNANIAGETRLASEHAGQAKGQFESQLVGREIDARRTEIQNALTSLQGQLTQEQTNALQLELAKLNDATQRLGIQTGAATSRYGIDAQTGIAGNRLGLDEWMAQQENDRLRRGI